VNLSSDIPALTTAFEQAPRFAAKRWVLLLTGTLSGTEASDDDGLGCDQQLIDVWTGRCMRRPCAPFGLARRRADAPVVKADQVSAPRGCMQALRQKQPRRFPGDAYVMRQRPNGQVS
jgi:hypothetical protein